MAAKPGTAAGAVVIVSEKFIVRICVSGCDPLSCFMEKYVSKAKILREDRRVCPSGAGALERRGRCCHGQPAAGGVSGYAGYFFIL